MGGLFDLPKRMPRPGLFGPLLVGGSPDDQLQNMIEGDTSPEGSFQPGEIEPMQITPNMGALEGGGRVTMGGMKPPSVSELSQRWSGSGVRNYITELKGHPGVSGYLAGQDRLRLDDLVVPKDKRSQGVGSAFMDELTKAADAMGRPMVLHAATDYGSTSLARVKKFYKRFGFVENKGRNYDPSISDNMYRLPGAK